MNGYSLVFGDLEVLPKYEGDGFTIEAVEGENSFGDPVPVFEVVESLMRDGSLTSRSSDGNRTAPFTIEIRGADRGALDNGEAVLMAELDKPTTIIWSGPFGAPSAFDVVTSWSALASPIRDETTRQRRLYLVTFEALPYARSVDPVTIEWSSPVTTNVPLDSLTGWTVVSGPTPTIDGGFRAGTPTRLRRTMLLDEFLWFRLTHAAVSPSGFTGHVSDVTVDGVEVDESLFRVELRDPATVHAVTVPTGAWRGQAAVVEFTIGYSSGATTLATLQARQYAAPLPLNGGVPNSIGVIDVPGSARAPARIEFTIPTSGIAFVYTAPDPNVSVRERGAPEVVFSRFEVTDPDGGERGVGSSLAWFPQGDHIAAIGVSDPQPVELYPGGPWPTQHTSSGAGSESTWTYPADAWAAISVFDTAGAKVVISASPTLPEGYHPGAVYHEEHVLHPGRCGFAVLDGAGAPIPATITFHPHHRHHADR